MRVSTTDIEQLRLIMTTTWASENELLAKLRGEPFRPTWAMHAGSAWGEILEGKAQSDEEGRYHFGDCAFRFDDVVRASSLFRHGGVHECKTVVDAQVDGEPVQLVAKVDYIWGSEITEFKCKWSAPDCQFYEQALQWRYYLWAFGASSVTYQMFHFAEPDKVGDVVLKDVASVRFWAYPEMETDCLGWIREFVNWARSRGLANYLERKVA